MRCAICGCPNVKWLRVRKVAAQLECSPRTVRRLIQSNKVVGIRVRREWRVEHSSLHRLVRRQTAGEGKAKARNAAGVSIRRGGPSHL